MTSASPTVSSTADLDFAARRAPWSNDAEQAVLGAMLLDQDAALKGAEFLDARNDRPPFWRDDKVKRLLFFG